MGVNLAELDIVEGPAPRGVQQYFICPISQVRCRVLYLLGGRLGTAAALDMAYPSQSLSPMRRAECVRDDLVQRLESARLGKTKREALVRRLEKAVSYLRGTQADDWIGPLTVQDQRAVLKRGRRGKRIYNPSPLSTEAALLEGRRRQPRETSATICRQLDFMAYVGLDQLPAIGRKWTDLAPISDFPVLDIRALRGGQGRAAGLRLVWTASGAGIVHARLRIDEAQGRVLVRIDEAGDAKPRFSVVTMCGGLRPGDRFFLCPESASRHLKLYYRNGRFASADAQNLMTATEWARWQRTIGE